MDSSLRFAVVLLAAGLVWGFGSVGHATIFSDDFGSPGLYTIAGDGDPATNQDIRFGVDYGSLDVFGDLSITALIGEAPSSTIDDTPSTGIFISANNAPPAGTTSLIAGIYANGINVGQGTATPDYVLRFDAFHSVTTGIDGNPPSAGTNYQWAGINYNPAELPAGNPGDPGSYRGPFATGTSGLTLAHTGEQGGFDDYEVTIGNTTIEDRNEGFTGLATAHIERLYEAAGFTDANYVTPIAPANQDDAHATPRPSNPASFDSSDPATFRQFWREEFPSPTGLPDYVSAANENLNSFLPGGTPFNRWATHEVSYINGVWSHVIDGVPVLQVDPAQAGDGTQSVSTSGTFGLGFLDGFSSFNQEPIGSNFVIYDNITLEAATSDDAPRMNAYLVDKGYVPSEGGYRIPEGLKAGDT